MIQSYIHKAFSFFLSLPQPNMQRKHGGHTKDNNSFCMMTWQYYYYTSHYIFPVRNCFKKLHAKILHTQKKSFLREQTCWAMCAVKQVVLSLLQFPSYFIHTPLSSSSCILFHLTRTYFTIKRKLVSFLILSWVRLLQYFFL